MARNTFFIRSNEAAVPEIGEYEVFGTIGSESLFLEAGANVVLDASFNKGGDTISIDGHAADFTARLQNANLILTSPDGSYVLIPVGTTGATLAFNTTEEAVDLRDLAISNGSVVVGGQVIPNSGSVLLDASAAEPAAEPANPPTADDSRNALFIRSSEAAVSGVGSYEVFGTIGEETLHIAGDADVVLDASFNKGRDTLYIEALATEYTASLQNANLILTNQDGGRLVIPAGTVGSTIIFNTPAGGEDSRLLAITNGSVVLGQQVIPISGSTQVVAFGSTPPPTNPDGTIIPLSSGTDIFSGTSGNDLFEARLTTDANGETKGTLTTGDRLAGGAGSDTLSAELNASALGAVRPTTVSVETVRLTALTSNPSATDAIVELDARGMYDVESFNSSLSTASLLISHANTLAGGNNGPIRATDAIAVRMVSTAGTSETSPASDFIVLFDEPYLVAAETTGLVTLQVRLDNVGSTLSGGDLLLGSSNLSTPGQGIERLEVTLAGEVSRSSSLASLSSTNDALRELIVTSATAGVPSSNPANLVIGNAATVEGVAGGLGSNSIGLVPNDAGSTPCDLTDERNSALVDVILVDATGLAGNFELHASLTDNIGTKLLAGAPASNGESLAGSTRYLFGAGNDLLNLNIAQESLRGNAADGDFRVTAAMGAGSDRLEVQLGDGQFALGDLAAGPISTWYGGHLVSENLVLSTGAGADEVRTYGATAAIIETGAGNDLVFTDNSGATDLHYNCGYATWLFNTRNLDVNALTSEGILSAAGVANLLVSVTYLGFTRTIVVGESLNSPGGVTITDLDVNAAITTAINTDPVLGELLNATQGPGRALAVLSRVDGEYVEQDLVIELFNTPLTTTQIAAGARLLDATQIAAFAARYDSQFAEQETVILDGRNSQNLNSNRIETGAGNDVVVLSSNVSSIETLKFTGAFGIDHVSNFSAYSDGPAVNESQVFFIDQTPGSQGNVTSVTYSLFGQGAQTLAISAGATATQIAQAIATDINSRFADLATASVVNAGDGQNNLVIEADGPDGQGVDLAATTIKLLGQGGTSDGLAISVVLGDIVDGQPGGIGFDIFDLSALSGDSGAPGYFFNGTQHDGDEVSDLRTFVQSGVNGVVLIDTLYLPGDDDDANSVFPGDFADLPGSGGRTTALEAARLQKIVAALDDASTDRTAGDDTQRGVIITVEDPDGGDGQSANFYQYVNGEAAGDATVTYLGTVRLADYADASKDLIGNWDAMTIENFTPLSPNELFDTYIGALVG